MPIKVPVVQTGLEASIDQAAKKAGRSLGVNLGKSSRSIDALSQPLGRITGKADEFTKSMEAANARVLAFGASVGVLGAVTKAFKDLVVTTIQVEKQLASINTILNRDAAGLTKFKKEIFDVARNTEQSFDTVATAALELSRQGLEAEEVLSRLGDAMILSRLSGLGAAESVSGLTAAINSFAKSGITSSEILNKLSSAAKSAAVSERDLIEAIKRSASVANQAGVSFDELVGVVTAVQQRTARGGAVIGNSFKTIFTRLQSFENLKTLQNLGVQITDVSGTVLPATKLIENLSGALANLPDQQAQDIATGLVGRFQVSPFLAILEDFNSEQKIAIKLTKVAQGATNEAYLRNIALNQTLSAAINASTVNLKEFADILGTIGVTDNLKGILTFFNEAVKTLTEGLQGETIGSDLGKGVIKGISNVISGPGLAIFTAIVGKLFFSLAKFGFQSLTTFFGLAKSSKDIATTQGQIASTLLTNRSVQESILAIENSTLSVEQKRVAQTRFFTTALNEQLAIMSRMQAIAGRVAPGVVAGTRSAGRRGRANGYIPNLAGGAFGAEMRDISMGVGGAPSTAKAVPIPNFNFGGGVVGPVVANDSEFIVPNFGGGGGSAIFNQDMAASMGLPPNAQPINASGGIKGRQVFKKGKQIGKDSRFAMLTPEPIALRKGQGVSKNGEKFNFNIYGFDKNRIKARDGKSLENAVEKAGINIADLEADNFRRAGIKTPKIKKAKFNAGVVTSMAGTIFEESLKATTDQFKNLGSQNNQSFDFFGKQIGGLRGRKGGKGVYPNLPAVVRFADAKANAGQNDNFADKMARFGAGNKNISERGSKEMMGLYRGPDTNKFDKRGRMSKMLGIGLSGSRSKAGGYIPNFSNGEPKFTTPRGRQINLKQALAGFGGKEIFADAKKHMAAQAKSAQAVTAANNKQVQATMGGVGAMGVLTIASSFLTGATQDATSTFGKVTNTLAKSLSTFAMLGFAGSTLAGIGGDGSRTRRVGEGLSKLAIGIGAAVGGFQLFKGLFNEFSGANKIAAQSVALLAGASEEAAKMLQLFTEEEKVNMKNQARGLGKRDDQATFFANLRGKERPLAFQSSADKATLQEMRNIALSSGVTPESINQLTQAMGNRAIRPFSTGGRGKEGFGIGMQGIGRGDIVPSDVSQEAVKTLRARAKLSRGKFDEIRDEFRGMDPAKRRAFGKGENDVFGEMLLDQGGFTQEFSEAMVREERKVQSRGVKEFEGKMRSINMEIAGATLKGQVESLRVRQSAIKAEERLLELQQVQGVLTNDEVVTAKVGLKEALFRDKVTMTTLQNITNIAAKAKVFGVDEARLKEVLAEIGEVSFAMVDTADERESLMARVISKLDIENGLLDKNIKAENILLANSIKKLETEKNREISLINQTRELEKQVSVSTLLEKEARDIQNTLEGGTLQKDKVRNPTLFGRLSAGISLNAATNRMGALDDIKKGTGSIQEVRRIDLAEKLGKSLVSASQTFSENIADGLVDAISKGESLGDTLRNVAADFLNTMSKAFMNNAVNSALNIGGGFFGFNSGGQVRGGSGMRDDVPALLTGGEFVMNKGAVQNYGAGFMGALNSGAVPKYANGGLFTPGTYGQGAISGSSNLLNFATQSHTGGLQDQFLSGSGLAGLALEPQSGRLTMFGRKNSPAFQREQESKRKAFSLFSQQYSKNQQEKQSKGGSDLLGSILGLGFSIGASALFGGGLSGIFTKGKATGGAVPYSAGIDSVPTMLSGGEFVMNAGASQRLGAGNLAALNAGGGIGGGGGDGAIVGKLDELNETIASSNTEINITVNSDGTENTNSSSAPEQQRNLAIRIKDVVRQVIEDEKRLGGSLRMA
jgi:TP901 family phage tail tape measure protein